jgi:hypothetical protein
MESDAETFRFDVRPRQRMVAKDPPIGLLSPRLTQSNIMDSWCIRLVDTYFHPDSEVNLVVRRLKRAFMGEWAVRHISKLKG